MGKEEKTRSQLADIIASRTNVGGVFVTVNADDTIGWHAQIIAAPGQVQFYQAFLERLPPELRAQYELVT